MEPIKVQPEEIVEKNVSHGKIYVGEKYENQKIKVAIIEVEEEDS